MTFLFPAFTLDSRSPTTYSAKYIGTSKSTFAALKMRLLRASHVPTQSRTELGQTLPQVIPTLLQSHDIDIRKKSWGKETYEVKYPRY